jgi:hypothetical protein
MALGRNGSRTVWGRLTYLLTVLRSKTQRSLQHAGAIIAVGVAYVLRGPARAQEASAAVGTPLERDT